MSLNFTQGDTAPDIEAVLHEEDDPATVVSLASCSVRFQMRAQDDHRYTVNSGAEIVDAAAGRVRYSWGPNDLARAGTFLAQWEITYPGGRVQTTYPEVLITIRRQ